MRRLILAALLIALASLAADAQKPTIRRLVRTGSTSGTVLPPVVPDPPVITTSSPLPSCTQNSSYTGVSSISVTGGNDPFAFALGSGDALPTGLSLNASTGAITGTCSGSTGQTTFDICVTDDDDAQDCAEFSLTVIASGPETAHTYFDLRCGSTGIQKCVSWRSQASVDSGLQSTAAMTFDTESMTRSGSTVTVTTTSYHGAYIGQTVTIARSDPTDYNGTHTVVSVPTPTTFTFSISGTPTTPAEGEARTSGTAAAHTSGVESCTITLTGSPTINATDDELTLNGGVAINGVTVSRRRIEAFNNSADVFTIDDTGGCPTIDQGSAVNWQSYYVPQVTLNSRWKTYGLGTSDYTNDTHSEKQDGMRVDIPNRPPEINRTVTTGQAHTMGAASCTIYVPNAAGVGSPDSGWLTLDWGRPIGGVTVDRRSVSATDDPGSGLRASSVTASGTTVTFITADGSDTGTALDPHGLTTGDVVEISGAAQSEYNGTFTVTVTNTTTFTYTALSAPSVSPATGTVRFDQANELRISSTGGCPTIPLASAVPWRTYKFPERHAASETGGTQGQIRHYLKSNNANVTHTLDDTILIGWENYWTADFLNTDNFDGLSVHKKWQISDGDDTLYFEIRPDYDQAVNGVSVAVINARGYQSEIGNQTQKDPIACGGCYTPYTILASRWIRFWVFIDLEAAATNHHKVYVWAWAQGASSVSTIFDNLSMRKAGGGLKKFWWEANTSKYASVATQDTLTQYSRNFFTITGLSLAQAQALLEAPPE